MSEKIVEISEDSLLWIDERYNRLREENKKLRNIIKEVREYIEEWQRFPHTNGSTHKELKNLIGILDKENK